MWRYSQVIAEQKNGKSLNHFFAQALREIAEAHAQQEPSFRSSIAFTRLTASEAIAQLRSQGFEEEQIPAASTMAVILNRMGYRLRKVLKAKPQKAVRPRSGSPT